MEQREKNLIIINYLIKELSNVTEEYGVYGDNDGFTYNERYSQMTNQELFDHLNTAYKGLQSTFTSVICDIDVELMKIRSLINCDEDDND